MNTAESPDYDIVFGALSLMANDPAAMYGDTARMACQIIERQAMVVDRLREALDKIDEWSRGYPLSIFPEPDFEKAHQVLTENGITLDAVAASCMRHVLSGVGEITSAALNGAE